MKLNELIARGGTSLNDPAGIAGEEYRKLDRHLNGFTFWRSNPARRRKLWEPQEAALATIAAYLSADRRLPLEGIANEAALVKMPTGTGKSAVIAVLCRCLPIVRRALVLTPREALTDQLYRYVRRGFWSRMNYAVSDHSLFSDQQGEATGNPVLPAYIAKLLPSAVRSILDADPTEERMVLVGTLQAMDMIRRDAEKATDPSPTSGNLRAADLLRLIGKFDLVVVDEGHYEPAISWSRAVRDADLPTVLFSATPYRNDYKSFRVRGRFVFNQPIDDAIAKRIVRKPRFDELVDFSRLPSTSSASPFSEFTDDTESDVQPDARDRADAAKFAKAIALAAKSIDAPAGVDHPKIIVRADERAKLEMLHDEIERVSGEAALTIHHAIKRNDALKRRFNSVKAAQSIPANAKVRYWLHQTKLLEGVDDSSFVAVAIYDVFGNARQLVQQIGRVLRSSDERRKTKQEAVVLASPEMVSRIEESWDHYLDFERYCAKNTSYLVTNEAALPDRLLATMPDIQYIEGQFRPRFLIEGKLEIDDVRLPANAAVFRLGGDFDKSVVRSEIMEAILNEDRFQPIEISGLPEEAIAIAYYGWQTSPLLTRQFFPEWKLGVCIVVRSGSLVLAHDTGGIVFDAAKLGLGRMDQTDIARGIPASASGKPVRVARISSASLDMSERAIRSQATRTRSFENTFTDLLDPAMVPTSAYAFLGRYGRYLGLTRARIRDALPEPLSIAQYIEWAKIVADQLRDGKQTKNPVFDRYARVAAIPVGGEADAKNILLDLGDSFSDFLYDIDDIGTRASLVDAEHDDLCADVDDGKFEIGIGGERFECEVEFVQRTGRYRIRSPDLDGRFLARSPGGRRSASTFTQLLNRTQSFRIIPEKGGIVYANGSFYEPQGFRPRPDGTIPQLQNAVAVPILANIMTEKGENLYGKDRSVWMKDSLFGLFKAMADHDIGRPVRAEWGELGKAATRFDLIVCDDDGQEVGDFLAVDTSNRTAAIIHAKASSDVHKESITALEVVGRQALASLAFCSTTSLPPKIAEKRWENEVQANAVKLKGLKRVFKNTAGLNIKAIETAVAEAVTNRSWSREIWIVAARLMDLRYLAESVKGGMTNRNWQLLMYIDGLATACGRGNARLRVFCHDGADVTVLPPNKPKKTSGKAKRARQAR